MTISEKQSSSYLQNTYNDFIISINKQKISSNDNYSVFKYLSSLKKMHFEKLSLYSSKEEKNDLITLRNKYIFDGKELDDAINGLKKITSKEFNNLKNDISNSLTSFMEKEKEELNNILDKFKNDIKEKSIKVFLEEDFEQLPEQLKIEILTSAQNNGIELYEMLDDDLEVLLDNSISKYSLFVNKYLKKVKKYLTGIVDENMYKIISSLSSELNDEQKKEDLETTIYNLNLISSFEEKTNSFNIPDEKILKDLKPFDENTNPEDIYLKTLAYKDNFLDIFQTFESFKDISQSFLNSKTLSKFANPTPGARIQALSQILIDVASNITKDVLISNRYGLDTSSSILIDRVSSNNSYSFEEEVLLLMDNINELDIEKANAISLFIKENERKITSRGLKFSQRQKQNKVFQRIKRQLKKFYENVLEFSIDDNINNIEKFFDTKIEKFQILINSSISEFDIQTRISDRLNNDSNNIVENFDNIHNELEKYIEFIDNKINEFVKIYYESVKLLEVTEASYQKYLLTMKENLDILDNTISEFDELNLSEDEQNKILNTADNIRKNLLEINSNIKSIQYELNDLKVKYNEKFTELNEMKTQIGLKINSSSENFVENIEDIKYIINSYSNDFDVISSLDIKRISDTYFSDTKELILEGVKEYKSLSNLKTKALNEFQKQIGYDIYKELLKSFKEVRKIDKEFETEKVVKEYYELINEISKDYGYKEEFADYENELYSVALIKQDIYMKIFSKFNSTDETSNVILKQDLNDLVFKLFSMFPNRNIDDIYIEILTDLNKSKKESTIFTKEAFYLESLQSDNSKKLLNKLNNNSKSIGIDKSKFKKFHIDNLSLPKLYTDAVDENIELNFFKKIGKAFNSFKNKFSNEDSEINPLIVINDNDENKSINFKETSSKILNTLSIYSSGTTKSSSSESDIRNIYKTFIVNIIEDDKNFYHFKDIQSNLSLSIQNFNFNDIDENLESDLRELFSLMLNGNFDIPHKKNIYDFIVNNIGFDVLNRYDFDENLNNFFSNLDGNISKINFEIKQLVKVIQSNIEQFKLIQISYIKLLDEKKKFPEKSSEYDVLISNLQQLVTNNKILYMEHIQMLQDLNKHIGIDNFEYELEQVVLNNYNDEHVDIKDAYKIRLHRDHIETTYFSNIAIKDMTDASFFKFFTDLNKSFKFSQSSVLLDNDREGKHYKNILSSSVFQENIYLLLDNVNISDFEREQILSFGLYISKGLDIHTLNGLIIEELSSFNEELNLEFLKLIDDDLDKYSEIHLFHTLTDSDKYNVQSSDNKFDLKLLKQNISDSLKAINNIDEFDNEKKEQFKTWFFLTKLNYIFNNLSDSDVLNANEISDLKEYLRELLYLDYINLDGLIVSDFLNGEYLHKNQGTNGFIINNFQSFISLFDKKNVSSIDLNDFPVENSYRLLFNEILSSLYDESSVNNGLKIIGNKYNEDSKKIYDDKSINKKRNDKSNNFGGGGRI